jgi:membrane-anchored glycerophosphoryl diester phosphodiesterase (GDPDase)
MDKYAIGSICVIIGLIIWHAVIGAIVFLHVPDATIKKKDWVLYLDRSVLCIALGIYIIIHLIFLIWLYCVPYRFRRELKEKDIQYNKLISNKRGTSKENPENNSNGVSELV